MVRILNLKRTITNKMQINLIKAHGTQNYFFIIYNQKNNCKLQSIKIINKIFNLNNNQRIDGLLLLSNHDQYDFKMDYYNNDGTWETMCANGARCAALYMSKYHSKRNRLKFLAGDGLHLAEIVDDDYV